MARLVEISHLKTSLQVGLHLGLVSPPLAERDVVYEHLVDLGGRPSGTLGHDEEGQDGAAESV